MGEAGYVAMGSVTYPDGEKQADGFYLEDAADLVRLGGRDGSDLWTEGGRTYVAECSNGMRREYEVRAADKTLAELRDELGDFEDPRSLFATLWSEYSRPFAVEGKAVLASAPALSDPVKTLRQTASSRS